VTRAVLPEVSEGPDDFSSAMHVKLADVWTPIPVHEVVRRTLAEFGDDNVLGLAAQLAFYFFLALFPALLFLVALIGQLPVDRAMTALLAAFGSVAPRELIELLRTQLDQLRAGSHAGLLTFGILGAIWSSSAAMVAIIDALNRAYDVTERRPWWKRRLLAVVLTIGLAVFIISALVFVLVGPDVVAWGADWFGIAPAVILMWQLLRWPLIIIFVVLGVDLVYHFAPNLKRDWAWLTPGSILATILWIAVSFAFKFYISRFAGYGPTHGAIGSVIVVLLWFYLSSIAILVGAEVNGVIDRARRHGEPVRTGGYQ
jgi:membrane protein